MMTLIHEANRFVERDIVFFLNPDQEKAWDRLSYKIAAIDAEERTIEIANVQQSQYNWKNLSRSPKPVSCRSHVKPQTTDRCNSMQ